MCLTDAMSGSVLNDIPQRHWLSLRIVARIVRAHCGNPSRDMRSVGVWPASLFGKLNHTHRQTVLIDHVWNRSQPEALTARSWGGEPKEKAPRLLSVCRARAGSAPS